MNTPVFTGNNVLKYIIAGVFCGFFLGLGFAMYLVETGVITKNTEAIAPLQPTITQVQP